MEMLPSMRGCRFWFPECGQVLAETPGIPVTSKEEPMTVNQIVGIVLMFAGLADLVLGFLVVGPMIQAPDRRKLVMIVLSCSSGVMILLGILFLTGIFGK